MSIARRTRIAYWFNMKFNFVFLQGSSETGLGYSMQEKQDLWYFPLKREVKLLTAILKPTLGGKWMKFEDRSENASNDIFYFSVNTIGFEFQQMSFLMCVFFVPFVQKSPQMLTSTPLSSKFSWFIDKQKTSLYFLLWK